MTFLLIASNTVALATDDMLADGIDHNWVVLSVVFAADRAGSWISRIRDIENSPIFCHWVIQINIYFSKATAGFIGTSVQLHEEGGFFVL